MREADVRVVVNPQTLAVGPAVLEQVVHAPQPERELADGLAAEVQNRADTAHVASTVDIEAAAPAAAGLTSVSAVPFEICNAIPGLAYRVGVSETLKERVRAYWEGEPCGTSTTAAEPGTEEFYAAVERERYRLEPYIDDFAEFDRWRGRRVLEVGVGLGTDFVRFVRAGADAVGVDLTEAAVEAVQRRLELEGLGADVLVADAERLPFPEESFDLVYSYGVLHHTPDTERAVAEVRRVLRPGGEARIMLYSRRSWFAFGAWVVWALGRGRPWRSISAVLAERLESPGTKAYTQPELERLFAGFSQVVFRRNVTPYDRRVAGPVARLTGPRLGWFSGVIARP
jgi:SAM-dependent methyltransferase